MLDIKISVVIPIYNAEKYISKCLESIINQTIFQDIELILVDDGSVDDSGIITDQYALKYDNIKVYHIENNGVSHARNIGIEKAVGRYIAFADADDWVEMECYGTMYKEASDHNADLVATGLYIDDDNGTVVNRKLCNENITLTREEAIKEYLSGNLDVHICNKLFKREFAMKVFFDETIRIAEDRLFLFEYLKNVSQISLLQASFYHYYQNNDSAMHREFSDKNLDDIIVSDKICEMVSEEFPNLISYAKCMDINMKCRMLGDIVSSDMMKKYQIQYATLLREVRKFSMRLSWKFSNRKHFFALCIAKINPKLFEILRNNKFIKFKK